ncbi:hypothetical protein EfmAA96_11010 [Enterococcus faecium]|nr:hypothetical protein EfmAA96_11010 [Enterococcus faecium]
MEQNTICPDCGHQITAEDQQIKESIEETNTDAAMQDKSTEDAVFPDTELNDPIENELFEQKFYKMRVIIFVLIELLIK